MNWTENFLDSKKWEKISSKPYIKILFGFIKSLVLFYVAVEFVIFLVFMIDLVFISDDSYIEDRRLIFFFIPVVIGMAYNIYNRQMIKINERWILTPYSLIVPTIVMMLNFITIHGTLIIDLLISVTLGIILLVLHKFASLYFKSDLLWSYLLVLLAVWVLFSGTDYSNTFEIQMWDLLKRERTLINILTFSLPLAIIAIGAAFNEKAGIINIGLEGILVFSAFSTIYATYETGNPWIGVLSGVLTGGFIGLIHGILTIKFKSEQIVTGVAINLVAAGLTALLTTIIWNPGKSESVDGFNDYDMYSLPIFGPIFNALKFQNFENLPIIGFFFEEYPDVLSIFTNQTPVLYLGILVIPIAHIVLFKSSIGLRIRAIGEHPEAAATAGINVHAYQYLAVIISGLMTGLAGSIIAFELNLFFEEMTLGQGFYALAIMIFGKWTVIGAFFAAFFFGFFRILSIKIATNNSLAANTPPDIINIIPNIIALLALAGFIGRARPPKAIGVPYDPGDGE